jgi:hypothetical protein
MKSTQDCGGREIVRMAKSPSPSKQSLRVVSKEEIGRHVE